MKRLTSNLLSGSLKIIWKPEKADLGKVRLHSAGVLEDMSTSSGRGEGGKHYTNNKKLISMW